MRYVAFLRGINVGGRKPIKMADLRVAFEGMGFTAVETVQASGNVLFAVAGDGLQVLAARIATGLEEAFGYRIGLAVRRLADLEALVVSDPFKGVAITPQTRLYVTFLSGPVKNGTGIHPQEVRLVSATPGEVLTAIELSPDWGTTDLMAWLKKEFGPGLTTRNWNTIAKIVGGG
jgi:uncharacterized protein (DUF1697 family)